LLNTINGPVPRNPEQHPAHTLNTSRVVEEDMQHLGEEAEILAVLAATGWSASVNGEAVPLVAFVALDTGRMYGASLGIDGRVDLLENDVEKHPGFAGYTQTNEQ